MAYRTYANTNGFIVAQNGSGDFTSITAAISAINAKGLTSGVLFLSVGTYIENPIIPTGWEVVSFPGSSDSSNVVIKGKTSFSGSGFVGLSGIQFQTNGDYALSHDGSQFLFPYINNCSFSAIDHKAINSSNTNGSSNLRINYCNSVDSTFAMLDKTSAHNMSFNFCRINGSSDLNNISAGVCFINQSQFNQGFNITNIANLTIYPGCIMDAPVNTLITLSGTAECSVSNSSLQSLEIPIFIGSGCSVGLTNCSLTSGAGQIYAVDGQAGGTLAIFFYQGLSYNPILSIISEDIYGGNLHLITPLSHLYGGTDLTSPGASGNVLTSNGTGWTSAAPGGSGTRAISVSVPNIDLTTIHSALLYTPPVGFNFLSSYASMYMTTFGTPNFDLLINYGTNSPNYNDNTQGGSYAINNGSISNITMWDGGSSSMPASGVISTNSTPLFYIVTTPDSGVGPIVGTFVLSGILVPQ